MSASRRLGLQEAVPALCHHHGIHHERLETVLADLCGNGLDDPLVGEHSRLHRVRADVLDDRIYLQGHERRVNREDSQHAHRVLGRERGDCARPVDAQRGKRLQVCLDSRPAPGIRAGDGQRLFSFEVIPSAAPQRPRLPVRQHQLRGLARGQDLSDDGHRRTTVSEVIRCASLSARPGGAVIRSS